MNCLGTKFVRLQLVLVLMSLFVLAGCGDGGNPPVPVGVVVKGKLTKGGAPLNVPHQEIGVGIVEVVLVSEKEAAQAERALAKPDGTFQIRGQGKGLTPGRYRLAVYQRDKGPGSDQLEGAFSDKQSPILVQIEESKVGREIDLGTFELDTYLKKK